MGSAIAQGLLWGHVPQDWAFLQEPQHNPLFEVMLDEANVSEGTNLLDAGCGGGSASLLAANRGAHVSGLDATQGLIEIARERVPNGDFRVGDIQQLPYDNDSFDAVIAPNSIQYAEDQVATLRELGRVCKSGGRIVLGLFGSPQKVEFRNIFMAMGEALPDRPKGGGPFALSGSGILENLVKDAGLTIIKVSDINCPFFYPDFETFWRGNSSAGPSQGIIQIIGAEKLKSALQAAVEPYLSPDGHIEIAPNYFKYVVAGS